MNFMSWRLTSLTAHIENIVKMTMTFITEIDWLLSKGRGRVTSGIHSAEKNTLIDASWFASTKCDIRVANSVYEKG